MNNKKPRYILYARKSNESEDKQMASIEDQVSECKRIADRLDLEIIDTISESKSAKTPGIRDGFTSLMERVHKGEADGIICWKLNRLARNSVDGGSIMWSLQENIIKHIQTFSRDYKPSDNVLLMAVEFGMATQYSKDLSIDVKRGTRTKAARGWYPSSQLPLGYKHNRGYSPGDPEIVSDEYFPIIKKLWRLMISGEYSIADIQKEGTRLGIKNKGRKNYGKPLSNNTYRATFTNPFYCGLFEWYDESGEKIQCKGKHKPMVSEIEFNKVQYLLGKRGRPTRVNKCSFPYKEHIRCYECSGGVTAERKLQAICTGCKYKYSIKTNTTCPKCKLDISEMRNPSIIDKTYYRCTKKRGQCSQKCLEIKNLEEQVSDKLANILIPDEFYDWAVKAIEYIHQNEIHERKKEDQQIKKKETEIVGAIDNLFKMQAEGEISAERRHKLAKSYETELEEIKTSQADIYDRALDWVEIAGNYLEFAKSAPKYFKKADDVEKTKILQTLGSNLVLKDKKLVFTTPKPLSGLVSTYGVSIDKNISLEPDLSLCIKGLEGGSETPSSVLCTR